MTAILFKTCAWCGIDTDNMPLCELHEAQAQNEQLTTDWIEATNTIHQYATEINSLRAQLATCHEVIGAVLALLRQEQVSAAMLVLDDALKGKK